eukprot:3652392-Prymnesium_polylepis.1
MDPYGDDAQNVCHHTPRHDAAVHEWASAAIMTFGSDNVLVDPDHSQPATAPTTSRTSPSST